MPTLMESVAQSLNGPALEQISSTLGTDQNTTMSAISAAGVPLRGLKEKWWILEKLQSRLT